MSNYKTGPGVYRQSLIATADSCMLRALLSMQTIVRSPSPIAANGTLIHRFGHQAVDIMSETGARTFPIEMGMELLSKVLCQYDVPADEVVPITMYEMKWARVIVTNWCQNVVIDSRRKITSEERFTADLLLPSGETVQVTGQLDLLLADPPDGLIVVDWKSGYRRAPDVRDEEKATREGGGLTSLGWAQWLIYSYLMFENFPSVNRVIFEEVHLRRFAKRRAVMERWEMERLRDVLTARVSMLHQAVLEGPDSKRWIATAGPHCSMCPAPRRCPIMKDEDIDISTPEGRQRVAQEWVVTTAQRTRRRVILDGLVEQYGPIEVRHSEGRRVVGWQMGEKGTRNFKMFEPEDIPESPYDKKLIEATKEAGVLTDG